MQDIDNQMLYRVVCREQFAELCCAREKEKVFYNACVMNLLRRKFYIFLFVKKILSRAT